MTRPGEFDKAIIAYTTEGGEILTVNQKRSLAVAVGNLIVPTRGRQGIPERWRYRYITIVTVYGGKYYARRVVIAHPVNPLWTGQQNSLQIDGVIWRVTERRGEYRRGPYPT